MIQTIILTILTVFGTRILFNWLMNQWRDVPTLYLHQQLFAAPTRFENESPIYRSIKCDDPETAPRVGLDIRYDHYKLRHGNFCDIWLLALVNAVANPHMKIQFDQELFLVYQINSLVQQYVGRLSSVSSVTIHSRLWLRTPAAFAVMVAAFITQTTVELYDSKDTPVDGDAIHMFASDADSGSVATIDAHEKPQESSSEFNNEYHFEKDKGIALRFAHQVSAGLISTTDFTQLNFVSATASTLRHLPQAHAFCPQDLLLVVMGNDNSSDLVGSLVKVLAALVAGSSICMVDLEINWSQVTHLQPSIVLALARDFDRIVAGATGTANSLFVNQLSRGIFWSPNIVEKQGIRLLYLQQLIFDAQHKTLLELNNVRSVLGARLVYERFNYTVAGPIILTDFYDYRVHNVSCRGSGALSQSLEAKLRSVGPDDRGRVFIRGYTIGKLALKLDSKLDAKLNPAQQPGRHPENNEMDGFMPLNVMGQWGADGCLYIF